MDTKTPVVNIRQGKLLEPFFQAYVKEKYPEHIFLDELGVAEKVSLFKTEWSLYQKVFFNAIFEVSGLRSTRNVIDVFIVSATDKDMSAPLIIRSRYEPKEFVNVLMHELLHIILTDNNVTIAFGDESKTTKNHIYVFALLTYLFKEILHDERGLELEKKKSDSEKNLEYRRAWDIVEKNGYKEIISTLKIKTPRR